MEGALEVRVAADAAGSSRLPQRGVCICALPQREVCICAAGMHVACPNRPASLLDARLLQGFPDGKGPLQDAFQQASDFVVSAKQ